ncbi:unnamed protein product [Lepeophtheirus salmonis]|uniref:(salmon louse) hypothetical protein n=1 Tax=Lepeophtheirus salmonis TaxID=72036 RepID=A0A7R8D0R2_LEPSM|nr:unnamed protein product [Lepeophtheirus salmonis]CAF2984703.1 unnamed protein product [Lepeophtheirus salmonis]
MSANLNILPIKFATLDGLEENLGSLEVFGGDKVKTLGTTRYLFSQDGKNNVSRGFMVTQDRELFKPIEAARIENWKDVTKTLKKNEFLLRNGLLFWGGMLVVPHQLQKTFLDELYLNH